MFRSLKDAVAIARSGIVDLEYYQAVTGQRFRNSLAAVQHFLASPERAKLSLHPLFEPGHLERKPDPDLVMRFLRQPSEFRKQSPHPVFDLAAAKRTLRAAGTSHPDGVWLAWARTATPDTPVPVAPGARTVRWGELRAALIRAAEQWRLGTTFPVVDWTDAARKPRQPGRTSIVVPVAGDLAGNLRRLALLKGEDERELVCTGLTSRELLCSFTALAQVRPLVLVPGDGTNQAEQWNAGAAASSGDRLVFVAAHASVRPETISELSRALTDQEVGIAQPLNETAAMTIHSAGAHFAAGDVAPSALLSEHPTTDAEVLGITPIPATLSAVVALRSEVFFKLHGFDERFANDFAEVDLSLRLAEAQAGTALLVPAARAVMRARPKAFPADAAASTKLLRASHDSAPTDSDALLRAAGFELTPGPVATLTEVPEPPQLTRLRSGRDARPRLRWTIDTPVTAGWWAQVWGDWHFANSLAAALRRLGQDVAVDTRQARERETRRFDDVLLTLRGLDEVPPAPGRVNLIWVISHPDEVRRDELVGYDGVFAASTLWAAERSAEWGILIQPLLQCTDAELFHPGRAQRPPTDRALFVGNIRPDRTRPMVAAAVAAGIGLDVYGTGWEDTGFASHVVARKAANADLGRLYAEAGVVLNDHWTDMRRLGFVSNRLFDAVACGARVLSDSIQGADELFGGSVRFCASPADAEQLLREPFDSNWPSLDERLATAQRVRAEHSFDQRARVLLDHAISALAG